MPTNAVSTAKIECTPFLLKVMIYSPEAGYKFDVSIQLQCTPQKQWNLIFNLYKKQKTGNDFDHIVAVEFQAQTPAESKALQGIADNGVNVKQSRAFRTKVHPAVKQLEDGHQPTPKETKAIHESISKAVTLTV